MMFSVTVHRKTRDLARDAAEDLLRAQVDGFGAIDRAELWTFEVEDAPEAETAVRRILDDTTLVVNPNLHRYTLDEPDRSDGARTHLVVTVSDRVDAKSVAVLRSGRERLGETSVTGVARSVQWTLGLDADEATALEVGREITGGGERGAGVLANSHAQDVVVKAIGS